jgi:hypothetical protein
VPPFRNACCPIPRATAASRTPRRWTAHCTNAAGTDPSARRNYPINPASTFYTNATPDEADGPFVRDLRCPGNNPGDNNDHDDHELIFTGAEGKFLPPPPELFGEWQYYNGADGIFFWTATSKSDAFLVTALTKLDEKFAECEADIIDATGGVEELDSDGDLECASGDVCFRLWMVMNNTVAVFNGDTDADETTAIARRTSATAPPPTNPLSGS